MTHRKATWRVEIQGLVCLLYVAAGTDFPDHVPELTLQVGPSLLVAPLYNRTKAAHGSITLGTAMPDESDTAYEGHGWWLWLC